MIPEALLPQIFVLVALLDDPEEKCPHCLGKLALVCKTWYVLARDLALEYDVLCNWSKFRDYSTRYRGKNKGFKHPPEREDVGD